jgi:hypothetical protein
VLIAGNAATANLSFTGMVSSVKITGGLSSNSSLTFGAAGVSLGNLTVAGIISGSTIKAAGNISSLVASALENDTISVGVAAGTTLATASTTDLGSSQIGSIRLTGKASSFANSSIIANSISSATLGAVNTSNNGVPEGLAAEQVKSVTLDADGVLKHLTSKQLVSPAVTFNDFTIEVK